MVRDSRNFVVLFASHLKHVQAFFELSIVNADVHKLERQDVDVGRSFKLFVGLLGCREWLLGQLFFGLVKVLTEGSEPALSLLFNLLPFIDLKFDP